MVQETMSAREQILAKIEPLAESKHPGAFQGASEEFDFRASLAVVGARVMTMAELETEFPGRRRYDKTVDGLSLAGIEVLEIDGDFGVAENGAIWLSEEALPHRVAPFICQHLVINVKKIVPHMHAAYEELGKVNSGFGLFLSGPSKTADIEQSLVIGAHGARSLTVVIHA
jgi:L-lactate dehydrogenase complex protein LldG